MVNRDTDKMSNIEKMTQDFYINGIYNEDNKLTMIPCNYLYSTKIIVNKNKIDGKANFYKQTGMKITNDFKTKDPKEEIRYYVSKNI